MSRPSFQFGLSTILWLVILAAINFWLFRLGPWGIVLAVVFDKHILVAVLCWSTRVDARDRLESSIQSR